MCNTTPQYVAQQQYIIVKQPPSRTVVNKKKLETAILYPHVYKKSDGNNGR